MYGSPVTLDQGTKFRQANFNSIIELNLLPTSNYPSVVPHEFKGEKKLPDDFYWLN